MTEQPEKKIHFREFKALSRAIASYNDLQVLANHLTERICRYFGIRGCSIMLFDEREKQLFRMSSYGISRSYLQKGPILADGRYTAFISGEPIFIKNFQNDRRIQYPEAAAREGLVSLLSVPIHYQGASIGCIRIYHDQVWELHDEDLESFCILADFLGLVIENNGLQNFLEQVKEAFRGLPERLTKGE